MKNPTHSFREMNIVFQLIEKLRIKSKTVMSGSSRNKKKSAFFVTFIFSEVMFLAFVFYLNA